MLQDQLRKPGVRFVRERKAELVQSLAEDDKKVATKF